MYHKRVINSLETITQLISDKKQMISEKYTLNDNETTYLKQFFLKANIVRNEGSDTIEVLYKDKWNSLLRTNMGMFDEEVRRVFGGGFPEKFRDTKFVNLIKQSVCVIEVEYKIDDCVILLKNGVFNTKTKEFQEDKEIVEKYNYLGIKDYIRVDYNKEVEEDKNLTKFINLLSSSSFTTETIDKYKITKQTIKEQRELKKKVVLGVMGSTLISLPYKMFINTYGKADTGKSKFYFLLESILREEQVGTIDYSSMGTYTHASAKIMGKKMIYNTESVGYLDGKTIEQIKRVASGGDKISYNIKNGAQGDFRSTAKAFINSNNLLDFKDTQGAMEARLLPLPINCGKGESEFFLTQEEINELLPQDRLRTKTKEHLIKILLENFINEKEIKDISKKVIEINEIKMKMEEKSNPYLTWIKANKELFNGERRGNMGTKALREEFMEFFEIEMFDKKYTPQKFINNLLEELNKFFKGQYEFCVGREAKGNVLSRTRARAGVL